jgi:GntR family transcriptional regulator
MLSIAIDRRLSRPVYEQVADQMRELIAAGVLRPGTPLPSVRELASDLGVNLNTIARGYRLLQSEGFLEIRDRAGVVVAPPAEKIARSPREELLGQLRTVLARLKQAGMQKDELLATARSEVLALDGGKGQRK